MSDQNSIPKAFDNFVNKGGIPRSETHVDFNTLTGDVRQMLRLQKQRGELVKSRDTYEELFYEEERENASLKMEVEQLNKQIENLMMPN